MLKKRLRNMSTLTRMAEDVVSLVRDWAGTTAVPLDNVTSWLRSETVWELLSGRRSL